MTKEENYANIAEWISKIPENKPESAADHKLKEIYDIIKHLLESRDNRIKELEEQTKAFYNWISSEDGIDTIHDLQIVGELPKGTPSFDQLKPHFKASLKQKI